LAGFPAFILSGEGPAGLAAQFAAHSPASCNVQRSCAVSSCDAGFNRPVQELLYCTITSNGPAYGRSEFDRRSSRYCSGTARIPVSALSFFLLYLALEGAVRFLGSLVTAEIVPSLLVFLFFKLSDLTSRSIRRQRQGPAAADAVEWLPNGLIRIASASAKAGWTSNITIGIDGKWFEIEREEHAQQPRPYIYVLRPAPPGKILRSYQEYEAVAPQAVETNSPDADLT